MSELTRCNYCSLEDIKRRHPGAEVTTRVEERWLRVFIDGEATERWFLELTDHCVC
jgi:hypothetical protein